MAGSCPTVAHPARRRARGAAGFRATLGEDRAGRSRSGAQEGTRTVRVSTLTVSCDLHHVRQGPRRCARGKASVGRALVWRGVAFVEHRETRPFDGNGRDWPLGGWVEGGGGVAEGWGGGFQAMISLTT